MTYKIYPLYCCDGQIIKSKLFYQGVPAAKVCKMQYSCFLLKSEDGDYMMVDTGYPLPKDIKEGGYEEVFPVHPNSVNSMEELLAPYGVKPEEIGKIFLTHLHYDHAWNLGSFPNAVIYVQKNEIEAAINPLPMENEKMRAYSMHPKVYQYSWVHYVSQFHVVDGDVDLVPGIRCILTRGHSMGSQTIIIDTKEGVYACPGDYAPSLDSIYKCIPPGMCISVVDWFADYPKVKKLIEQDVKFLSNHDPRTFDYNVYG